jgi:hypothetical protein
MRKKGIAFAQIAVYVESLGIETALKLVGGWGGLTLYVPGCLETPDPLIPAVLGADGADTLIQRYGGQTIRIPELDLSWYANLVRVATFKRHGFSDHRTRCANSVSPGSTSRSSRMSWKKPGGPWEKSLERSGRPARFR